jgi:TIR domain-containing protein
MAHVFFSYSRSDRDLARRLRRDLCAGGLGIWSDRELDLGGRWLTEISIAISESRAVLLLATPAALTSKWVMREIDAAQTMGIPVIPLIAEGARYSDLPVNLAGINGVDLADGYEESVAMIVAGLGDSESANASAARAKAQSRMLVLVTADERLAQSVGEISRSVGLVVGRPDGEWSTLLGMLEHAHIALIDGHASCDAGFVAGYVAGQGGWVICLAKGQEEPGPVMAGIKFSPRASTDLEREICAAAFLPVRQVR